MSTFTSTSTSTSMSRPEMSMQSSASGLSQSQSNNPNIPTSSTGASNNNTSNLSASSSNFTLTIEAALQAASNNPLAALEAVIAERNALASQNNQLWKLVEKQRAMHHAANRELEKLKRATGSGSPTPPRSGSPSIPSTTSNLSNSSKDPKNTTNGSQSSKQRADRPERPDRADGRAKLSQSSTDDQHSKSHGKANGSSSSSDPSRSARGDSQPTPTGTPVNTSTSGASTTSVPVNPITALNVTKKSSSVPSGPGPDQASVAPTLPKIVAPEISLNDSPPLQNHSHNHNHIPPPPPIPTVKPPPVPGSNSSGSGSTLGANLTTHRDKRAARESRITLPDEAARYIANMQDSPVAEEFEDASEGNEGGVVAYPSQDESDDEDEGEDEEDTDGGVSPVNAEVAYPVTETEPPTKKSHSSQTPQATPVKEAMKERKRSGDSESRDDSSRSYSIDSSGATSTSKDVDEENQSTTPMPHHVQHPNVPPLANSQAYQTQQAQAQSQSGNTGSSRTGTGPNGEPVRPQIYTQSPGTGNGNGYSWTSGAGIRPNFNHQKSNNSVSSLSASQTSSPAEFVPAAAYPGYTPKDPRLDSRERYDMQTAPTAGSGTGAITGAGAGAGALYGQSESFYDMNAQPQYSQPKSYKTPQQPQMPSVRPQLTPGDLGTARIRVSGSNIKSNDRGKEVLSFIIEVKTTYVPEGWKVEKMYSDVLALDGKVRSALGKGQSKRLPALPDAKLFRDNAPAKVDQRRIVLEQYLQALLVVPIKDPGEICVFFSTDLSRDRAPVTSQGYKEGYLTKRGKNFGGWKTRYFVLQNAVLEYFENRGGALLGSININGAQIGRQQKQASQDDDNAYRHAFLIIEQAKKGGVTSRHVLCASSDAERDAWVEVLVRSIAPSSQYEDSYPQSDSTVNGAPASRPSTSSNAPSERGDKKGMYATDPGSLGVSPIERPAGQGFAPNQAWTDTQLAQRMLDRSGNPISASNSGSPATLSSSLPTRLDVNGNSAYPQGRSNSSLGHHDSKGQPQQQQYASSADTSSIASTRSKNDKNSQRTSYHPSLSAIKSSHGSSGMTSSDREDSSDTGAGAGSKKISGPLNAVPIPAGTKFGSKDGTASGSELSPAGGDRERKAKSGRFWPTFGKNANNAGSGSDRNNHGPSLASTGYVPPPAGSITRAVFGVPLETALQISQIANLPSIIFRCIEYLEAKKAAEEEGIYRLSGSSAVIKTLKDRFNMEGDVNLLKRDEFWDPHAIAGLLKQFLRDLPTSILTRELQQHFLGVVDLMDPKERVNELASLVSRLPVANYSLLRAMSAHLILIVQNSQTNKMTMRNVGIVFSPTLGIPAGILSMMLGEFDRVFNVDGADDSSDVASSNDHGDTFPPEDGTPKSRDKMRRRLSTQERVSKRNSMLYANTDTDRMLGISGRKLEATEDTSDGDDVSIPEDSDTETDREETSGGQTASEQAGSGSGSPPPQISVTYPTTENAVPDSNAHIHGAKAVAAGRGLQISINKASGRLNRASGLPSSPRPVRSAGVGNNSPGYMQMTE